ncbi:hypothetical protein SPIRO4BDMA_90003 [uncultured spirochete]|uniref:Uncharacterized protein n=1 Tax=uncultured spirochete TaxID=156406 RepID=A0A3P3XUT3_9SPIR|nr:hypothetical protein SPIRO4BDMA_90003 [uncultured spirochete]
MFYAPLSITSAISIFIEYFFILIIYRIPKAERGVHFVIDLYVCFQLLF